MASEIRVDKINSLSGVGTVTLSPTGIDIAGITTAATLRATTGIVTSLTAVSSAKVGSGVTLSPDGDIFATGVTTSTTFVGALTGNVTGNISGGTVAGSTGTFSGAVSGTTGTFTGDLTIPDKIVHTGDTDTAIRLGVDTVTVETGGSERTRVDSSGRFGIGTNNPDSLLHVYGASTGYAKIETGDGSTNPIIMYKNPDKIFHSGLRGDTNDSYVIRDATASANRLIIDTNGKLSTGGETAPDVNPGGLCLNTGSSDGIFFSCKNSDIAHGRTSLDETDTLFSMRKISGNNGGVDIRGYTDTAGNEPAIRIFGVIEDGSNNAYCPVEIRGARKNTGGNTGTSSMSADKGVVRISNDGDFTVATFTGEGLCFHDDTSDSNALDDYEEGIFTPAFGYGLVGSAYESNGQKGAYTKIGRYVYGTILLHLQTASTQDGNVIDISGLPFTPINHTNGQGGGLNNFYQDGFFNANDFSGIVKSASTGIRLYVKATGAYLTGSSVNAGREIRCNFWYHAS